MKSLKYFAVVLTLLFLYQGTSNAQLKIVLGPAIGLTIPAADYSGETTEYYTGSSYALKSGVNFGAMGKVYLGPLNFNLSILYSPLSSNGQSEIDKPNSSVEIKQNLLTIGVGTQFGFGIPVAPVKPYIGLDLLFTSISGSSQFKATSNVTSDVKSIDMQTTWRTGLGISGGVEIKLMSTKVDASVRYNLINLFNKSYEGSSTGTREEAYKYLNDAKDPNYSSTDVKHPIGSNRSIATIQFELGVLFGF